MISPVSAVFKSVLLPGVFSILLLGFSLYPLSAQSDEDCMMCHEDATMEGMLNGRMVSMFVDTMVFEKSVHHSNSCISCHSDADDDGFPHADDLQPVICPWSILNMNGPGSIKNFWIYCPCLGCDPDRVNCFYIYIRRGALGPRSPNLCKAVTYSTAFAFSIRSS